MLTSQEKCLFVIDIRLTCQVSVGCIAQRNGEVAWVKREKVGLPFFGMET